MELEHPAAQLALVVSQLYALVDNPQINEDERRALLFMAHDLRGDLVTLVAMQFSQSTPAYQQVQANLGALVNHLDQAMKSPGKMSDVVACSEALSATIDGLIKEAAGTNSTGPKLMLR